MLVIKMTFNKISVLVPTRHRVERLKTMIASFDRTTSGRAELVFRIDHDDTETAAYLQTVPWRLKRGVFKGQRLEGYKSTPQFLLDMIPLSAGDVLMVGNDDMVFETEAWDKLILRAANNFPDGFFNIGVTTLNTLHYPFSIVSRHLVESLGFMYDPRIFWGDIYLRDIMAAFDRNILLPEVHITHDWAGYKPDRTFAEADHFKTTVGTAEYWQRHAVVVNEAVQRLRGVTV
jgi:hypothetical protein